MTMIKPFSPLRPAPSLVDKIASRPYDIVTKDEIDKLVKNNPYSFLRITRSECDISNIKDVYSDLVYEKSLKNLQLFKKNDWLIKDGHKSLFVYRINNKDRIQTGITGLFSCSDYKNGTIKRHENTRTNKEIDRTNHIQKTKTQTGQVYLAHNGKFLCDETIKKTCSNDNLLYDFNDDENVKHQIWRIPTQFLNDVITEISRIESLYIIDGHHRAAAAINNNCKYFLATLFPSVELSTGCCNRIVKDISPYSKRQFIEKISEFFTIKLFNKFEREQILMYLDKNWYTLELKNQLYSRTLEKVSSNILQCYILSKILRIDNPSNSDRIEYIRNTKGENFLEKRVHKNKGAVAFSLTPPTVDEVIAIANEGDVMPPKSTWFWPKLKDGLLIYEY